MKRIYLLVVCLFVLSACDKDAADMDSTSGLASTTTVVNENTYTIDNIKPTSQTVVNESVLKHFSAFDESELSAWDYETAYDMCKVALLEYYKAIWNGLATNFDTYIDNKNLNQYMNKKIESQYSVALKNNLSDNLVRSIDIGVEKAELVRGSDNYFYFELAVQVNKDIGSYAEPTEFLIQNLNGKLVIVDWYSNGKDSYDSLLRGDNQIINNPNIWNDADWVKNLDVTIN